MTDDAPIDNPCNNENKLSDQRSHGEFDGKSSIEENCEGIHIYNHDRNLLSIFLHVALHYKVVPISFKAKRKSLKCKSKNE